MTLRSSPGVPYIIDCDGHWHDGRIDFASAMPVELRARAPRPIAELDNRLVCDGEFMRDAVANFEVPGVGNSSFELFERRAGMWDPKRRLEDMDDLGIDVSVIFGSVLMTGIFGVGDPELAAHIVRIYHDALADYCTAAPHRLKGVAVMALQGTPENVIQETERAVTELGFVGIHFPSNFRGKPVTAPRFRYVFELANRLDVPVLIHPAVAGRGILPLGSDSSENLFYRHTLSPAAQMMSATLHVVCDGLLDEFPRLRVAILESGVGWLPFFVENADAHYDRLAYQTKISRKPSDYLRSGQIYFYADPGDRSLPLAIDLLGAESFIYSSDYWHWDAEPWQQAPTLLARKDLSTEQKESILVANGNRLYGWNATPL